MTASLSGAVPTGVAPEDPEHKRWWALGVVLVLVFMDFLDTSIVNVAIPSIQRDIGSTFSAVQWIVAGYTLPLSLLLITGGRLGDLLGRRRVFLSGVLGFVCASALCGLAGSSTALIAARVLQGAMAGVTVPQALALIQVTFDDEERHRAIGLYGAAAGLAFVGGPIIGGVLLENNLFGLAWRPIFLINVPLGLGAVVAGRALLDESKATTFTRLDLGGVLLLTAALLSLLYPVVEGRDLGWPPWTFVSMAASVPLLILFAAYERRGEARDGSPLIRSHLWRVPSFTLGIVTTIVFVLGLGAFFLMFSIMLQVGLGFSALHTAITLLPWPLAFVLGSGVSARLAARMAPSLLSLGGALLAACMGAQIYTLHVAGSSLHSWQLIPSMVLGGLGAGMVLPTITGLVLAKVPDRDAGSASGVVNTAFQLGAAIGVAALGAAFFGFVASHAHASARSVVPRLQSALSGAGVIPATESALVRGFSDCFAARMSGADPAASLPACRQGTLAMRVARTGTVRSGVADASAEASRRNLTSAFESALWFEVGLFLLAGAMAVRWRHQGRADVRGDPSPGRYASL